MTRVFALALAAVLCFASGVAADKVITRFSVALTDVTSLSFSRNAASPTGWRFVAESRVRGSDGTTYSATISGDLGAGARTAIETYITNNILAATNTQEGL